MDGKGTGKALSCWYGENHGESHGEPPATFVCLSCVLWSDSELGREFERTYGVREHARGKLRSLSSRGVRSDRSVGRTAHTLGERSGPLRQAVSRRGVATPPEGRRRIQRCF
jgi:hypothetical protein